MGIENLKLGGKCVAHSADTDIQILVNNLNG